MLYRLSFVYPPKEDGFGAIRDSFFNSFRIVDVEGYWFDKNPEPGERAAVVSRGNACIVNKYSDYFSFYSGPYIREGVGLLIPSDVDNFENTIDQTVAIVNNTAYFASPEEEHQMFFVPYEDLPDKSFQVNFGFILKEDSAAKCPPFNYQATWIEMNSN